MRIRITVGNTVLPAKLNDGAAARDFAALLPLDLELRDFQHNEKSPISLPACLLRGLPAGTDPRIGDLVYNAASGNLGILYREVDFSPGLVYLGHIDAAIEPVLDAADSDQGPTITIAAVDF